MKKGIAVFYDPHNVYQFLWYYCTYGKDVEWTALCLPNSFKGDQVSDFCVKLGFFKKIIKSQELFESWSQRRQLIEFLKMFFYACIGKQSTYAKNFLKNLINDVEYEQAVVLTDCGYVSGMFIALSKEKEIIILEDGMGDYLDRKYSNIFKNISNFYSVKGFILSLLGYVNFSSRYPLRTTKKCIKFSSHPDKMRYRKYLKIETLFDMTKTDKELFKSGIESIYPGILKFFCNKPDLILFTTPLIDYTDNPSRHYEKVEEFINKNGVNRLLIKKHPRDGYVYHFDSKIDVKEIPQIIPAEVLLPYLSGIQILFMDFSSTNLYMSSFNYSPKFLYFTGLCEERATIGCSDKYASRVKFIERLGLLELDEKDNIIDL